MFKLIKSNDIQVRHRPNTISLNFTNIIEVYSHAMVRLPISQYRFRYASHCLNQCSPSSLTHICDTRGKWVNRVTELPRIKCNYITWTSVHEFQHVRVHSYLRFNLITVVSIQITRKFNDVLFSEVLNKLRMQYSDEKLCWLKQN